MAKTEHYHTRFKPGRSYHVYNRSVDRKPMFATPANYQFFLERMKKYLLPVADVFAYNLLGNHFHLLIRIKDGTEDSAHKAVSHAFQRMFQSYALASNKQQVQVGTLFQTPFKRVAINTDEYFNHLVWYIHANPQIHGIVADFRAWPYSSFHALLSEKPTLLLRRELLELFGGRDAFLAFHDAPREIRGRDEDLLEDW